MPALFLSHGAPPLVDDERWVSELARWATDLPTPPTLDPQRLLDLGARLRPLRDDGVLVIGSGFTTHGLPYLTDPSPDAEAPGWSREFDVWAAERFAAGDLDALLDFRARAPGMPYAHPTIEHFAPLFVALGASSDPEQVPKQVVDGFWMGLAKRSLELA